MSRREQSHESGKGSNQSSSNSNSGKPKSPSPRRPRVSFWDRFKVKRDYRASLHPLIARFTGYRAPGETAPYEPLPFPPFTWLKNISLQHETWLFAWVGSFVSIMLIEAIMSTNTAFQEVYHSPLIVTSFGASAVLIFGVIEAPVSQPRNLVGGHFISAFMGTWITRLWVLNPRYEGYLDNEKFHPNTFVNGALSMSTSLLAMLMTTTVHPPAGATGLNAAVEGNIVTLSWRYLPVVVASSLIMLGWAVIVNNLGRRRYPQHWWAPGVTFVRQHQAGVEEPELETGREGKIEREHPEEGIIPRASIGSIPRDSGRV